MSAYMYDQQHIGNGNCDSFSSDSEAWVRSSKHSNAWQYFNWSPYHYDGFTMLAGETMEIKIDMMFSSQDLRPSDYSFVVWSDAEPVNISVTHGHKSEKFPTFRASDSVCIYNLQGDQITCNGSDNSTDSSGGGSSGSDGDETDDGSGDETGGDTVSGDQVSIIQSSDEMFSQKFKFANGNGQVTNSIEALDDEKTLVQTTMIDINGDKFRF